LKKIDFINKVKGDVFQLKEKVIGILGGMGPEATVDLFHRIVKATASDRDQGHLRIIIDNNPKIPDRTEAILHNSNSSLPELIKTARNLERAGADFIVMPCNAAHHYYKELKDSVGIPFVNMIELTSLVICKNFPAVKKVGVIATNGTIKAKLYDSMLRNVGIEVNYPIPEMQQSIMEAIYNNIKAGKVEDGKDAIINVAKYLANTGSELIVFGCTEISLALNDVCLSIPIIDPLQILSEAAITMAFGKHYEGYII
jgi:aspartate racemase